MPQRRYESDAIMTQVRAHSVPSSIAPGVIDHRYGVGASRASCGPAGSTKQHDDNTFCDAINSGRLAAMEGL